jgi:hypothetical protein
MKKQNIKKTLDSDCLYDLDGCTLRDAATTLLRLAETYEAQGYTDIRFAVDHNYDDQSVLTITGVRVETDEEAIAREQTDARRLAEYRERDIMVLKAAADRLGIKIENI